MIRKILLILIAVALVYDVLSFIYIFLRSNDLSGFFVWLSGLICLAIGLFLTKRNNVLGSIVLIALSIVGLQFVYEVDGVFFSMALLKYGPQVMIMNALEMLIMLFSMLYLFMRAWQKIQNRKNACQ
jgi:hypothetical protein